MYWAFWRRISGFKGLGACFSLEHPTGQSESFWGPGGGEVPLTPCNCVRTKVGTPIAMRGAERARESPLVGDDRQGESFSGEAAFVEFACSYFHLNGT